MLTNLTALESRLDSLLPKQRLALGVPLQLMAAAANWAGAVWDMAMQLGPMPLSTQQISNGLALSKNPVYIFGVHRSGTTLLRDMLDGHPQLAVLPSEGTWYTNQEQKLGLMPEELQLEYLATEWLRRLANPINQAPYWLLGRSHFNKLPYVDFARYVMAWWKTLEHKPGTQWPHLAIVLAYATCTNSLEAKYWVDKTPTNERYLNRIKQEMPAAKIIHMVRHPYQTVASRKKMEPTVPMRNILSDLKTSFQVAARQSGSGDRQFLLLTYEDLCADPDLTVKQLTDFLAITPSATLLQPTVVGMPAKANSSFNKQGKAGQILKAEQHPETLSKSDQQLIANYLGNLSAQLDYPLQTVGFLKGLLPRLKHRLV